MIRGSPPFFSPVPWLYAKPKLTEPELNTGILKAKPAPNLSLLAFSQFSEFSFGFTPPMLTVFLLM